MQYNNLQKESNGWRICIEEEKIIREENHISNLQRTGILITLLVAAFITAMSITVTGNMIPNFTAYFGLVTAAIIIAVILYLRAKE